MTDIVVLSSVGFTPSPSPDSERSRWGFALVEESSFADRGSMSRQSTVRLIECRKSNKKNGKKEPCRTQECLVGRVSKNAFLQLTLAGPFAFLLLRRVGRLHFLDGWSLSHRPVSYKKFHVLSAVDRHFVLDSPIAAFQQPRCRPTGASYRNSGSMRRSTLCPGRRSRSRGINRATNN